MHRKADNNRDYVSYECIILTACGAFLTQQREMLPHYKHIGTRKVVLYIVMLLSLKLQTQRQQGLYVRAPTLQNNIHLIKKFLSENGVLKT